LGVEPARNNGVHDAEEDSPAKEPKDKGNFLGVFSKNQASQVASSEEADDNHRDCQPNHDPQNAQEIATE